MHTNIKCDKLSDKAKNRIHFNMTVKPIVILNLILSFAVIKTPLEFLQSKSACGLWQTDNDLLAWSQSLRGLVLPRRVEIESD